MTQHRSIRKYQKKDVSAKLITTALKKAIRASSSGNMQTYSVIVTRDEALRRQLWSAHLEQDMVLEAPVMMTFCGDNHRHTRWSQERGIPDFNNFDNFLGFMISAIDAILVSQNCALALEEMGLGICYLGSTFANAKKVAAILETPPQVIPVAGFVVGWPAEWPPLRDRLPLDFLVHNEKYQPLTKESIDACYHERETTGWKRYNEVPELRAKVEAAQIKNLAQIYAKAKYTKADYDAFSAEIIAFLKANHYL